MRNLKIALADIIGFVVLAIVFNLGIYIYSLLANVGFISPLLSINVIGGLISLGIIFAIITLSSQLGMMACASIALALNKNDDPNVIGYRTVLSYTIICMISFVIYAIRLYMANGFIWWMELPFIGFIFSTILNLGSGKLKDEF